MASQLVEGDRRVLEALARDRLLGRDEGLQRLGDVEVTARTGDAIAVPPHVRFAVAPAGGRPLRMLCCMPVAGQACTDDGAVFTPPWAA